MSTALEALADLESMTINQLRDYWRNTVGEPVPRVSAKILRLALAWETQAKALGGLSRTTSATLDQLARSSAPADQKQPSVRLVREWKGQEHIVTVSPRDDSERKGEGTAKIIQWDGREWNSLSEVARAITGTRWSGPAFFRLKKAAA